MTNSKLQCTNALDQTLVPGILYFFQHQTKLKYRKMWFLVILFVISFLSLLKVFLHAKSSRLHKPPPGPWAMPIFGNLNLLQGPKPHRTLAKLAQKYGPIMSLRLGQVPGVVVSSPQAAKLFLSRYDKVFASRPMVQAWPGGTKGLIYTPYGDYWEKVKMMSTKHLLSASSVEGFAGLRRSEIESFMQRLKQDASTHQVVDVSARVGVLIEDIIYHMLVGKGQRTIELKAAVQEGFVLAAALNLADYVPFLASLDLQGFTPRIEVVNKKFDEVFKHIIEEHLQQNDGKKQKDIVDTLLALMNTGDESVSSFTQDNVRAIIFDLVAGGIGTTVITITWALSSLLKNPRVLKILQEELDSIVGKGNMVEESHLPKLTYLDMVVKETLRLYPAVPLLIPHECMEDTIVDGFMISKKSQIIINFWAITHDSKVWSENVDEFHPERFMDTDVDVRGRNFELMPFGAGLRRCPGINLAMVNSKLVLAQLVHCFDWQLPNAMQPHELDMTEMYMLVMPRASPLLAVPSPRF